MTITKFDDLKLKLGNLALAVVLSTVPTAMTIGFLGAHGWLLCNKIENTASINSISLSNQASKCEEINISLAYSYIIWIWLFIMIPTWRWFYISHSRRIRKNSN